MQWIKALPALLSRRWRRLAVTAAGAALLLAAALLDRPMLTAWLALALAIPALLMAYVALVKAKTLEFCPEILGGDVFTGAHLDGATVRCRDMDFTDRRCRGHLPSSSTTIARYRTLRIPPGRRDV